MRIWRQTNLKLVIAGSRDLHPQIQDLRYLLLKEIIVPTEIVSGTAKGVDTAGEKFAEYYDIKLTRFPADWNKYGKSAGPIRNKEMAIYCDAAFVLINNNSSGSRNMVEQMKKLNKPCYVFYFKDKKYEKREKFNVEISNGIFSSVSSET